MRNKKVEESGMFYYFKWAINSVLIPITCALISAVVIIRVTERPTTVVYKEVPIVEKFSVLDYFPLKRGNYWIYDYRYKLTKLPDKESSKIPNIDEGQKKFKVLVENAYTTGDYYLIILKGDMFRGETDKRHGFLIVSNKVYYIEEEKLDIFIQATIKKEMLFYYYFNGVDLYFEFPLYNGQKYGEISQMTRSDLSYFWVVERTESYLIQKDNKLDTRSTFVIKESTVPGDVSITFVPYLGIIGSSYHHHGGTIEDMEFTLVDYKLK